MKKTIKVLIYWIYLLLVWGLFRLFFKLDNLVEELVIKPVVWGWPIIGWQLLGKKKERINLFIGNMLKAVGSGAVLGLMFGVVIFLADWLKTGIVLGKSNWSSFSGAEVVTIGLATAIVEEAAMAGFVLLNLKKALKNESLALLITTLINTSLHLPIALFVYSYSGAGLVGFLGIVALVGVSKYYLMLRTENVWAPIVAHWMWGIFAVLV